MTKKRTGTKKSLPQNWEEVEHKTRFSDQTHLATFRFDVGRIFNQDKRAGLSLLHLRVYFSSFPIRRIRHQRVLLLLQSNQPCSTNLNNCESAFRLSRTIERSPCGKFGFCAWAVPTQKIFLRPCPFFSACLHGWVWPGQAEKCIIRAKTSEQVSSALHAPKKRSSLSVHRDQSIIARIYLCAAHQSSQPTQCYLLPRKKRREQVWAHSPLNGSWFTAVPEKKT